MNGSLWSLVGEVETVLEINDDVWLQKRGERAARLAPAGTYLSAPRRIRPTVEVRALFTPMNRANPEDVIKATGAKGELIRNAPATELSVRVLSRVQRLAVPLAIGSK